MVDETVIATVRNFVSSYYFLVSLSLSAFSAIAIFLVSLFIYSHRPPPLPRHNDKLGLMRVAFRSHTSLALSMYLSIHPSMHPSICTSVAR